MYAAVNGYLNTAEFLRKRCGANIAAADRFKRNALHWASRYNNVAVINCLLEMGMQKDEVDFEGQTAADLARNYVNIEAVQALSRQRSQPAKGARKR